MQPPSSNIVIEDHSFYTTLVELENDTQTQNTHAK